MLHETSMSSRIKIWHPNLARHDVESVFGMEASIWLPASEKSDSIGQNRNRSSYALFEIFPEQIVNSAECERKIVGFIADHRNNLENIVDEGGQVDISIRLYDASFISIILSPRFIAAIPRSTSITIENYSPEI